MTEPPKYQLIAILSGIFTILGFSHLLFKVYVTKQTDNFTFTWIALLLTSQILLITYGILNNSYGLYLPPILLIIGILYIMYVKIHYKMNTQIEDELREKHIII